MEFNLTRTKTNNLYTEGCLYVTNDKGHQELYIPYTVEDTKSLIPTGIYSLGLVINPKSQHRKLTLMTCDGSRLPIVTFEAGHSHRTSHKHHSIVVGEELIPGAVFCGQKFYTRLFDRVEKAEKRGETINVFITDHLIEHTTIYPHWVQPENHGCGYTTIHVEVDDSGQVTVFDGDQILRQYPNVTL